MQDAWMEAYLRLRSCVCQCPVVRACSVCHVFCEISFILYEITKKSLIPFIMFSLVYREVGLGGEH